MQLPNKVDAFTAAMLIVFTLLFVTQVMETIRRREYEYLCSHEAGGVPIQYHCINPSAILHLE